MRTWTSSGSDAERCFNQGDSFSLPWDREDSFRQRRCSYPGSLFGRFREGVGVRGVLSSIASVTRVFSVRASIFDPKLAPQFMGASRNPHPLRPQNMRGIWWAHIGPPTTGGRPKLWLSLWFWHSPCQRLILSYSMLCNSASGP